MNKRICISIILVLVFSLAFAGMPAYAQQDYKIIVNGSYMTFDIPPKNVNGRLLVPMRALYEELGASVLWDQENQTVWAQKGEVVVVLPIGSLSPTINGEPYKLDVPAELMNGRTLVPLRFAAESLNLIVKWNAITSTAMISELSHDLQIIKDTASNGKTQEQIKFKWQQYAPVFNGNPYVTAPTTEQTYEAGVIQNDFIADGVNMANFVRYLADLPDDLEVEGSLNRKAQHGAVLLTAHGSLSHTPPQPENMELSFYREGYESTSSSNLAYYGYYSSGSLAHFIDQMTIDYEWTLANSVRLYMRDEDDVNLKHVGHRRWILNPSLKKVGFGYAHHLSADEKWKSKFEAFSTMQIFDTSRSAAFDYEYIAWPNQGNFPVEFFKVSESPKNSDPWSLSLNPQKFQEPRLGDITVTLKRQSDQREWKLDQEDQKMGIDQEYLNVSNQNIGVPYCIIFRPNQIEQYKPGDIYEVNVKGLKDIQGQNIEIDYAVSFFSLK